MTHVTIQITGMSCGGCVRAVRNALSRMPGVQVQSVDIGSATISYDESRVTPQALAQAIRDAGYQPLASGVPVAPLVTNPPPCGCGQVHGTARHSHAGHRPAHR